MREIIVGENEANQRLDRFLLKYLNKSTRGNVFKLLRKKVIKVNNKKKKENYYLKLNDKIQFFLSDEALEELRQEEEMVLSKNVNLDIVYEDDEILVVNKPKGLLTHPNKNEYKKTLTTRVQTYLNHLATRTFKPASVNRLDRNTSGLILFCKTYDALKKYNKMMRNREIKKYYICIVHGRVKRKGEIKGYLDKDHQKNIVKIREDNSDGKGRFIHTRYKPLEYIKNYTLLEVEILTGRTHQIRASLSKIGHPIVGDTKYGGKKVKNVTTQVLHAYKLIVGDKIIVKDSDEIKDIIGKLS
ncbi:MAG: rRNA pseudouridine synthase [Candidatus Petromonas sp.]|nr:rRNA pseudouridine synthase [Candidatus Petromonas sp.]